VNRCLVLAVLLAGCARTYSAESMRKLDITGRYDTVVSLLSSKCPGVRVEPEEITVDHVPGSSSVQLSYHGLPFVATIQPDGKFRTTDVSPYRDSNNWPSGAWIDGRFSAAGFEATVRVRAMRPACEYRVRWRGSRQ
jgi:hypothetical protein